MYRNYRNQNRDKLIAFDLAAPIIPGIGAAGITFEKVFADFEYTLAMHQFEVDDKTRITCRYDNFTFIIEDLAGAFKLHIDAFSGKTTSMFCNKLYKGRFSNGYGIGSKMSALQAADNTWGFDLDHSIYVRYPFDGVIIYPPHHIVDAIYDANCGGDDPTPDFDIEAIEILEMNFARQRYADTLFYETE